MLNKLEHWRGSVTKAEDLATHTLFTRFCIRRRRGITMKFFFGGWGFKSKELDSLEPLV